MPFVRIDLMRGATTLLQRRGGTLVTEAAEAQPSLAHPRAWMRTVGKPRVRC
jgi:hypothetical protein